MKKEEYNSICSAVEKGKFRKVEHRITRQHGKVVACDKSGFEVATADGDREGLQHWERYNCEKD